MEELNLENTETKKSSNQIMIVGIVLALIVVAGGVFAVSSANNSNNASTPATQMGSDENNTVTTDSPAVEGVDTTQSEIDTDVRQIDMEAGSFYFKPETITVKKGETVQLTLKSVDMMHDFYIDELNVKSPITQAGETSTVTFTPDRVGTFEYYCSVGSHRKMGQVGKIIVVE